ARAQHARVGTRTVRSGPDGDLLVWQRPNQAHGMVGEQYRTYPKSILMRQVSVDARGKDNRADQFQVVTTILDPSVDGGQIADLCERRWRGEVDIRSTMKMDVLRCKTPEMVRKERRSGRTCRLTTCSERSWRWPRPRRGWSPGRSASRGPRRR